MPDIHNKVSDVLNKIGEIREIGAQFNEVSSQDERVFQAWQNLQDPTDKMVELLGTTDRELAEKLLQVQEYSQDLGNNIKPSDFS